MSDLISVRIMPEEWQFKMKHSLSWRYIIRRGIQTISKELGEENVLKK